MSIYLGIGKTISCLSLLLWVTAGCGSQFAEGLRTGCLAGCNNQPRDNTSLSQDPGADPGKPSQQLRMVWLHHSTGNRLLGFGLRSAIESNNITFYDINYHEARIDDYVIGDHTDPPDFPRTFNTPRYLKAIIGWELDGGQTHNIVMFKSCYPASNIHSDERLSNYKAWYNSLLPTFRANPKILFIPMTPPPLVKSATTPDAAARARRWAHWLSTQYGRDLKNVQVFDLFNALAIQEGKPGANTLVPQFAAGVRDSHPNHQGGKAVTRLFIPWLNRALREAGIR